MNTNKRFSIAILAILFLSIFLTACGGNPVQQAADKLTEIYAKAQDYYNRGVSLETNTTNLWRAYEQVYSNFRLTAMDLIKTGGQCYQDVAAAEATIAEAVMGNKPKDSIINSLTTDSVSGEAAVSKCAELNRQLADYIISNRREAYNAYMRAFESATGYMQYTSNFPEIDIMNDLMDTYLSAEKIEAELAKKNIHVTDWTWLPTTNLWVSHTDRALCNYYISGEFKQNLLPSVIRKFKDHEGALESQYAATWNPAANRGNGECRMYRTAALEYMTRSIISDDTRGIVEGGSDSSVFPTNTPTAQ